MAYDRAIMDCLATVKSREKLLNDLPGIHN